MKKYLYLIGILSCILLISCGKKEDKPKVEVIRDTDSTETYSSELISSNITESTSDKETSKVEIESSETTYISQIETTEEVTTEEEVTSILENDLSIDFVKNLVSVLLGSYNQSDIDSYLSTIALVDGFTFNTVVNKETTVLVENIGVNSTNAQEYLAIVTLKQQGGISKFAVLVEFENTKLSKFSFTKF